MRVLYFGTYEREYPRNAQVISCLRSAGVDVVEHHVVIWDGLEHKFGIGVAAGLRLALAQLRLLRTPRASFDVMIVGYPGHFDMRAARRVAGGRPIVFNPLLSLYDSMVSDRGRWSDGSIPARLLEWIDRDAISQAEVTVADTEAHAEYLAALGRVPRTRIEVCYLGAEEQYFQPGWNPDETFRCLFYGKLIPLHGLDTILGAIRLTPDISYRILGSGQLDHMLEANLPPNAEWIRWMPHDRVAGELRAAGCALGIFGTTDKALRVIPNKAFEALACGVPLVTADTPASRELLADGDNALLVPPGNAPALATAIRRIKDDPALARRIAAGGLELYRTKASEAALGARWREVLERATSRPRT